MEITLNFKEYFLRHNRNLVTIDDLVEHLSAFQKIIYAIANEKKPSLDQKNFRFLINKFEKGSVKCLIEPYYISRDISEKSPVEDVVEEFAEIATLIDTPNEKETFTKLKEKIRTVNNRMILYTNFKKLIPDENNSFQIFISSTRFPEGKKVFSTKEKYKKRIKVWREMDKKSEEVEFIGVIKNLNAYHDDKKYVKIIGSNGEKIKLYYNEEQKEQIINYYDSEVIKVKGIYNEVNKTLEKVKSFKELKSIKLDKLNDIHIIDPFELKLSYEFGMLYGSNDEYRLYAMGSNYNELLKALTELIFDTLALFSKTTLSFTSSSLKFREKFSNNFKTKSQRRL